MSLLDTIAALHAELDAHPDAHDTRLILADALDEAGDPRAEGYRALARLKRYPYPTRLGSKCPWYSDEAVAFFHHPEYAHHRIPDDWFNLADVRGKEFGYAPDHNNCGDVTRRELDDAFALAFSLLPAERRAALLQTPVPA